MSPKKKSRRPISQPGKGTAGSRQREAAARARAEAAAREGDQGQPPDEVPGGAEEWGSDWTWSNERPPEATSESDPAAEAETEVDAEQEEVVDEEEEESRPAPLGARAPAREPAPRDRKRPAAPPPGMFGGLRAPSPFPRFRTTMVRAGRAVADFPALVVFPLVAVLVMWLGLVAMGL